MKITELTKDELCELVKSLKYVIPYFTLRYGIDRFLRKRWERKKEELLAELDKVDVTKNFAQFKRINDELDKLHNNAVLFTA